MKFLAKLLGLPTKQQMIDLNNQLFEMSSKYDDATQGMHRVREDMAQLRQDMKDLYSENTQELNRIKRDIKAIKPVLKVQDPEAVKFIKDILRKHDHKLNTQQSFLETKMIELNRVEGQANKAVSVASEAAVKINNVIKGLGLEEAKPEDEIFEKLRNIIKEANTQAPLQVD